MSDLHAQIFNYYLMSYLNSQSQQQEAKGQEEAGVFNI